MATLNVYATGISMVPDYEALSTNARRFVGRSYDPSIGSAGGWVIKKESQHIPYRPEYRQAILEGDLLPADAETASLCGVTFKSRKQS